VLLQLGTGVPLVGDKSAPASEPRMWEVPNQFIGDKHVGAGVMVGGYQVDSIQSIVKAPWIYKALEFETKVVMALLKVCFHFTNLRHYILGQNIPERQLLCEYVVGQCTLKEEGLLLPCFQTA